MNDYANIDSSKGMLKTSYDSGSAMSEALKKKRQKMGENKLGLEEEPEKENENG